LFCKKKNLRQGISAVHQVRCCLWKNTSDDPKDEEEEVSVKKVLLADALNCAKTFLEFLERE
jgi:hypothetical protein